MQPSTGSRWNIRLIKFVTSLTLWISTAALLLHLAFFRFPYDKKEPD